MLFFHNASILWSTRWNDVKYKPYIAWIWFGCLTTFWSDLWLRSAYWSSCILKLHDCWNSADRLCAAPVICRWWRALSMFHRPRNYFFSSSVWLYLEFVLLKINDSHFSGFSSRPLSVIQLETTAKPIQNLGFSVQFLRLRYWNKVVYHLQPIF